jgi:hypothetical protein
MRRIGLKFRLHSMILRPTRRGCEMHKRGLMMMRRMRRKRSTVSPVQKSTW